MLHEPSITPRALRTLMIGTAITVSAVVYAAQPPAKPTANAAPATRSTSTSPATTAPSNIPVLIGTMTVEQWEQVVNTLAPKMTPEQKSAYAKGLRAKLDPPMLARLKWSDVQAVARTLAVLDDSDMGGFLYAWLTTDTKQTADSLVWRTREIGVATPLARELNRQLRAVLVNMVTKGAKPTFKDWEALSKVEIKHPRLGLLPPVGQGHFVMSLCEDKQGRVWVGCEDAGVWCWDPSAEAADQWQHFTRANTGGPHEPNGATVEAGDWLGDDNGYAIACDKIGRVWVGHLNHGVSVFNGKQWRNYGVFDGPVGERVYAIATNPVDGDVWIGTSAGVTRYRLAKDEWDQYTRADGLPSNQISALAFHPDGTVVIGTDCDGIALGSGKDDYKAWRCVPVPKEHRDAPTRTSSGDGLPSDMVNDVTVTRDGVILVATAAGLAVSRDAGSSFSFTRGPDWSAKRKSLPSDLVGGSTSLPAGAGQVKATGALAEDYVTRLSADSTRPVYIGYRTRGVGTWSDGQTPDARPVTEHGYTTAMLPAQSGERVFGTYGSGLSALPPSRDAAATSAAKRPVENGGPPPFPKTRSARDAQVLTARLEHLAKGNRLLPTTTLTSFVGQDWHTQGNWVDRYGNSMGVCAAMAAPYDHVSGHRAPWFHYDVRIGQNAPPGDSVRYWVHDLKSNDPRALVNRVQGGRRQSEWDDHGEAYPITKVGPHLFLDLKTPPGMWRVSLYFRNKDSHSGPNRLRDYRLSLRGHATGDAEFHALPELASARVHDFWGGVWVQFQVVGDRAYTIKMDRNHSYNVICSGVFVDPIIDPEAPKPRKRFFSFYDESGQLQFAEPSQFNIEELERSHAAWVTLLDRAQALRWQVRDDALLRLCYAEAAKQLKPHMAAAKGSLTEIRFAIETRRRLALCYEGLNMYSLREACVKEMDGLWPVKKQVATASPSH